MFSYSVQRGRAINYPLTNFMKRRAYPKVKAVPVSKLKKKLWQLCREITIARYGSTCYTCGKECSGSNRHCGHFIPSSICSASMRYDLDNLRIQCYWCNILKSGNWPAFEEHLIADGFDPNELKRRNRETTGRKYDSLWYQTMIYKYECLLDVM